MNCPACGSSNQHGVTFCHTCGAKLEVAAKKPARTRARPTACPACGTPSLSARGFCTKCGTRLDALRRTPAEIQQAIYQSGLPVPKTKPKTKTLSVVSLVLGLAALTPATFLAGIPAVVCGAIALRQHRPGFWQAVVGMVTGAFGTLVLTFALLLPLMARHRELARVAAVQRNMHAYKSALQVYAKEHAGRFPPYGISWDPADDDGMLLYFEAENGLLAGIPVNPYTGQRYHRGKDFFYLPVAPDEVELKSVGDRTDPKSPLAGLAAPGGTPGTILILGWSPVEDHVSPAKYIVAGYGSSTAESMAGRNRRTFLLLHN